MNLLDYITGPRRGPDAHRLEREAMGDPFLSEAMEGYDTSGGDPARSVERLRRRVEHRVYSSRRRFTIRLVAGIAAAAAIVLVVGPRFLIRLTAPEPVPVLPYLAENYNPIAATTTDSADLLAFTGDFSTRSQLWMDVPIDPVIAPAQVVGQGRVEATDVLALVQHAAPRIETVTAFAADAEHADAAFVPEPVAAPLAQQETMEIAMTRAPAPEMAMDEVVAVGYGTTRKRDLTGSVATLESEQLSAKILPADTTKSFQDYLKRSLRPIYDMQARRISGTVTLGFRVNRRGRPIRIEVLRSLSPRADTMAVRLLENGPDWPPADKAEVEITFE